MASPVLNVRLPGHLLAALDAKAASLHMKRSELAVDILTEALTGLAASDQAATRPARPAGGAQLAQPRKLAAKAALQMAEAKAAHLAEPPAPRSAARLDTSSVPVFDGGKRLPYQKRGKA